MTGEFNPSSFCGFTDEFFSKENDGLKKSADSLKNNVIFFDETDSTNTQLIHVLEKSGNLLNDDGSLNEKGSRINWTLATAVHQTGGKGRLGRPFYSPSKSGVYFSLLYVPEGGVKNPALYTAAAAVSVCRAAKDVYGLETQIKWVNDIYCNGKKLCGILTEGITEGKSGQVQAGVIGIGINLEIKDDCPENVKKRAGGILDFVKAAGGNADVPRVKFLAACAYHLVKILYEKENFISEYRQRSFLKNSRVKVSPVIEQHEKDYWVTVVDVSEDMGLVVKTDEGEIRTLYSGEVSMHQE